MRAYKITDVNDCTYKGFQWYEGKVHKTDGEKELCSSGWIHFYRDKRLAVILNPIHGKYNPFHLWRGEAGGKIKGDVGLKWGCTEFRMIKRVSIPKITLTQRVAFGILCSLEIYNNSEYKKWAENWLVNKDRTTTAAAVVAQVVWETDAARGAAQAAAQEVEAAAQAAAEATAWATESAAWATESAAREARINLVHLATECLKY